MEGILVMVVTKHAIKRVKERTGLKKKLAEKLLTKALVDGIKHKDTKGKLRKYMDWIYFSHETGTNVRLYNNYVFVCNKETFITIFMLPQQYRKIAKIIQSRRKRC